MFRIGNYCIARFPVYYTTTVRTVSRKLSASNAFSAMADAERENSRPHTNIRKIIGTHNGTFHCDEAFACYLLKQTPTYRDADIVRSRDSKILDECDIVVDVGGVYDAEKHRYDHHQRSFQGEFGFGYTTKLSSAGLIYKHFGREIISELLGAGSYSENVIEELWLKLYKEFVEAIDAIDNGISQYAEASSPRYRCSTDLSSRVSWLNPAWNENVDSKAIDALFLKASALTGDEFIGRLNYYASAWLPARDVVKEALLSRGTHHPDKRVLVFECSVPWKEHLFDLEEQEMDGTEKPLYILFPDETAHNWRIQAVPISIDSFESRKALPQEWRGIRDDALSQLSGIPGCIFVHASGFIGGNATKEGAMAMATAALECS